MLNGLVMDFVMIKTITYSVILTMLIAVGLVSTNNFALTVIASVSQRFLTTLK
jgi:hypothetical protein